MSEQIVGQIMNLMVFAAIIVAVLMVFQKFLNWQVKP